MAAVYANMHSHEELVSLFSRNLTLDPVLAPAPAAALPAPAPEEERKIVYISQHYNHSAHIAATSKPDNPQPATRPASEPPHSDHTAVEQVLREHGVDPTHLSRAQLQLFQTADTPQQLRLLELWRVCPPTLSWPGSSSTSTSLEQEEALARQRFDEQQQQQQQQRREEQELIDQQLMQDEQMFAAAMETEQQQQQQQQAQSSPLTDPETVMSLDDMPLTPVQAGDGRWLLGASPSSPLSAAAAAASASYHYMEPYMASGYEEMARREYEASVRRAYAEAVAAPLVAKDPAAAATLSAGHGAGGDVVRFNPSHADPVYKATNVGGGGGGGGVLVVDWRRQQAAMADQYGRIMAMREDEEML